MLAEGGEILRVPGHLGEALDALEEDDVVRSALPGRLYDVFMHYKRDEWERFLSAVTDWERERTGRPALAMCGIAGIIYRDGTIPTRSGAT